MRRIIEDSQDGLEGLMGQRITLFSLNYIYTGDLVGVNEQYVLLKNPAIVYETGSFDNPSWADAQALPNELFIMLSCVEAFGVVK